MIELLLQTPLTEQQTEYAQIVKTCSESLLNLINNILDFSKMEMGKLQLDRINFNLDEVVEDVLELLGEDAANKAIELVQLSRVPENSLLVVGDAGRLKQVLINLLSNAIKFSSNGGEVVVSTEVIEEDSKKVKLRYEVVDRGIGIPSDLVERLFKPFSQLDNMLTRKYQGTGLGLVRLHFLRSPLKNFVTISLIFFEPVHL
jgi:two-component system sensor histidine kinase/response regulator